MRRAYDLCSIVSLVAALTAALLLLLSTASDAQRRQRPPAKAPSPTAAETESGAASSIVQLPASAKERLEADVSSRSVAVTSTFSGSRIVVFGSVVNSRQTSAESGYYDLVVVLEGEQGNLVARMKSRVAGIWLNTDSLRFSGVPSYYAIVSTRPLDDIADPPVLNENAIGFEHVRMLPPHDSEQRGAGEIDLATYRTAVTRLKRSKGLFLEDQYGVSFIGRSLFRASVDLPPNIPIGNLTARMHLFRDGELLDTFRSRVVLQREGLGNALHSFALEWSLLYGIGTVLTAIAMGLAATAMFSKSGH